MPSIPKPQKDTRTTAPARSIESEIGQTRPFSSDRHRALVNLMFTYGWHMERMRSIIDAYGITVQQYNVLRILRGAGEPLSTSSIRSRMLDRMSDTSRLVDRLEKKGLVQRRPCAEDKRLVDVSLVPEGQRLLERIDRQENDFETLADGLTQAEAQTLSRLLDRLRTSSGA
jgi:DNA-binding MarR family transcriptional regulator